MIPVCIVAIVFTFAPAPHFESVTTQVLAIAAIIPLLITPPIAYVVLNLIRVQAESISKIDARIMFDMMTGVFNRNFFLDSIRAHKSGGPMMIVDADHFKQINDTYGHAVGDEALRILGNALKQCVGSDGIVGRLGGEEFGIFMPGHSFADGVEKAEAICKAIRALEPFIAGKHVRLSVSIGCAFHRATHVIGHSMKHADDLLYQAKSGGRDQARYDMDMLRRNAV